MAWTPKSEIAAALNRWGFKYFPDTDRYESYDKDGVLKSCISIEVVKMSPSEEALERAISRMNSKETISDGERT